MFVVYRKVFMKNRGFSLIETIIVISIILVVFYFTIPKINFMSRFIVKNETDKLFSICSFLQQRAVASNKEHQLFFDVKEKTYLYKLENGKDFFYRLPDIVDFGFFNNVQGPPSKPKRNIHFPVTFKSNKQGKYVVTFYTDGKVSPGTAYLIDKNKSFMFALTCPISQISFIRKYEYDNGRWVCLK